MSDEIKNLKDKINFTLELHLSEMKEGYDDSIVGFHEAWNIVRKIFKEFEELENL